MKQSWGIIGVGHLGASLIEGIHRCDSPVSLCLSPRSASRVQALAARFPVEVGADNQAVVDACDHVILAVRPDRIIDLALRLRFRPGQIVVSVAAAVNHASLESAVGPATAVRAMPVLSAAIGDSPTCIFPGNDAAMDLFQLLGPIHSFEDEPAFEAAAVAATYYGWVYALMNTPAHWLEQNGVATDTSRALIAQMTRAACSRCLEGGGDMGAMAAEIAREGTFSAIGMSLLSERGALDAWSDACQSVLIACRERGRG